MIIKEKIAFHSPIPRIFLRHVISDGHIIRSVVIHLVIYFFKDWKEVLRCKYHVFILKSTRNPKL